MGEACHGPVEISNSWEPTTTEPEPFSRKDRACLDSKHNGMSAISRLPVSWRICPVLLSLQWLPMCSSWEPTTTAELEPFSRKDRACLHIVNYEMCQSVIVIGKNSVRVRVKGEKYNSSG